MTDLIDDREKLIKALKGHWIHSGTRSSTKYTCSNCNKVAYYVNCNNGRKVKIDNPPCDYKFCPNCGAEMEMSE